MKKTTLCLTLAGLLSTSAVFAQTAPADTSTNQGATTSSSQTKSGKPATATQHAKKKVHKKSAQGASSSGT